MSRNFADTIDQQASDFDADSLNAAKRRRASRMPAIPQDDPRGSAGDGEQAPPRDTANKLTKGQKTILIRLVATLHYVDAVRDALAEEYPGFPEISDNLIRYYRRQVEAEMHEEAKVARDQALRSGLASKAVRVRHLSRMYERWSKVPLVEEAIYINERGQQVTAYKTREGASREMREILKQIAQELGEYMPSAPAPAGSGLSSETFGENPESEAIDADVRADLQELLASMADRDAATEQALAAAVRPA